MRGLDIRIEYAQRKLVLAYRPDEVEELWAPVEAARAMGVHDYANGQYDAPILFRDEPALLDAWEEGQQFTCACEEMAQCSGCHDPDMPLCPVHD